MHEKRNLLLHILLFSAFCLHPLSSYSLTSDFFISNAERIQHRYIMEVQTDTSVMLVNDSSFTKVKPVFLRIYNERNKKIIKGLMTGISRNSVKIEFELKDTFNIIHFSRIQKIKTRRSAGANYLWGSIVGTSLGLSLIVGDPEFGSPSVYDGRERVAAVTGGMVSGFIGGVVYDLFKNSKIYAINGDYESFLKFYRESIARMD